MERPSSVSCRHPRLGIAPPESKEEQRGTWASVALLWLTEVASLARAASRVPLGTLYLFGRGPERACPTAARAAGQSAPGPGPAPREPAPPSCGAQLDSGQRAGRGRGRGAPLCLLSPPGLCPSNSRFLKEPRPDRFAPILAFAGTHSDLLLVARRSFGRLARKASSLSARGN